MEPGLECGHGLGQTRHRFCQITGSRGQRWGDSGSAYGTKQ
jgi:hypothetical protein